MDLTMVGAVLLVGYFISNYFLEEAWDAKVLRRYKKYDVVATFVCLFLIVGSGYHLFGG